MTIELITACLITALIMCFVSLAFVIVESVMDIVKKRRQNSEIIYIRETKTETTNNEKVEEVKAPVDETGIKKIKVTDDEETFEQRLEKLSKPIRKYCSELRLKASSYEKVKCIVKNQYIEYRIGSSRIIRLKVKYGILYAEFILINFEMKSLMRGNKSNVKEKPIVVKVDDQDSFELSLNSIQLAYDSIQKEKQFKKEQKRKIKETV